MKVFITVYLLLSTQLFFGQNLANWPKTINSEKGKIVIYQPQPENFEGNKLTGRAAIAVTPKGYKDPIFGAIWFDAVVETDKANRIVTITSLAIPTLKFPDNPDEESINTVRQIILEDSKTWTIDISLDQLLATLDIAEKEKLLSGDLNMNPPIILYTSTTSVLVYFDGEPIYQKIEDSEIKRAVNTPYLIMLNPDDKKYYLSGGDLWFVSADGLSGYENVSSPPKNIRKAAVNLIGEDSVNVTTQSTIPQIITATIPTELVQTNGEASYQNIAGTDLLYIDNTDNQLFMDINTQLHYLLISGRWFTTQNITGPWSALPSENLPADFKKIPEGSEKDVVLASIPGTKAAEEAILNAQIPQTATVDRNATITAIEYDGSPKFETIEGTDMQYAVNTSSTVIKSGNTYYVVDNGVWFQSKSAEGPWVVSDSRPAQVDEIPPSSEVYNVKYVYIYDSTPDVFYVGYTPGYTGSYVYGGTVVYGTGYYYDPWRGYYYYPAPVTYGYNMYYNPYAGWSFGYSYSYNYYYPHYHYHYPHYGGWYGPPYYHPHYPVHYNNGYCGPNKVGSSNNNSGGGSRTYNPESNSGNRSSNLYNNHEKGVKTPDKGTASKGNVNNSGNTQNKKSGSATTNQTNKNTTKNNNMYTDKQGNVYKDNGNNNWQTQDAQSKKWTDPNSNPNTKNTYQQNKSSLDQSAADRNRGNQNYNNSTKKPSYSGGAKPSGGGAKSGGGSKRR